MGKSLESESLAALHLLSTGRREEGINYIKFVEQNIMNGALDLIEMGYATKIKTGEDDANYILTDRGKEFLDKILKYASEQV